MIFKIETKHHILIFSLATTLWTFFLLGGLSSEYYQTWSFWPVFIIVDVFPTILIIPLGYYIMKYVVQHEYLRTSLLIAFYASIPLVIYDTIYIGFYLNKGLGFFVDYWYLTVFYFVPWIIMPLVAIKIKNDIKKKYE